LYGLTHDEEKSFEVEVGWITTGTRRKFQHVPKEILKEAEEQAKKALADEEDDDD
jgi:hypothetical protein